MEVRKKASFSLRKNIANSLFLFHGAVGQQCSFLSTGSYLTFTNARGKSKSHHNVQDSITIAVSFLLNAIVIPEPLVAVALTKENE